MFTIQDLPAPPDGKTGFPWTEGSTLSSQSDLRISIVTPSYNQGAFLEETLRSALLQNHSNLELIVIDGGSTDNSVEIIQKYADFIAYWVSEPDTGQTNALNKGLEKATGEVMGWLNSDDLLLPNALYHIATAFKNPSTSVVCGFRKIIDPYSKVTLNWMRPIPYSYRVRHRNIIAQETVYWRRDVLEKVGFLNEAMRFIVDYEYWERIVAAGYEFTLLPYYLGGFRLHDESKTTTIEDVYHRELDALFQRYGIAENETEAVRKSGRLENWRFDFTKDLSHQSISDDPRRVMQILRLIDLPLVSLPLLGAYRLYCWLR